jgi:hypothetical protein
MLIKVSRECWLPDEVALLEMLIEVLLVQYFQVVEFLSDICRMSILFSSKN